MPEQPTKTIDTEKVLKSGKHATLMLFWAVGMYASYKYGISGYYQVPNYKLPYVNYLSIGKQVAGVLGVILSIPGLYNQFRHTSQHATAAFFPESDLSQSLNQACHTLPHMQGVMTTCAKLKKYCFG